MRSWLLCIGLTLVFMVITSCTTVSSCLSWNESESCTEKADFFLSKAQTIFDNDIVRSKNYTKLSKVYDFIDLSLKQDPWHTGATRFLEKVDCYVEKHATACKETISALLDKKTLTSQEEYIVVRNLSDSFLLEGTTFENTKFKARTLIISSRVKSIRKNRLADIATKISTAENAATIGKLATEADSLFSEIKAINELDRSVDQNMVQVTDRLAFMIRADIAEIRKTMAECKYGVVKKLLLTTEKKITSVYSGSVPQLEALKYEFYMKWAGALISVEAYEQAAEISAKAAAIQFSDDARRYKQEAELKLNATPVKTATAKAAVKKVQEKAAAGRDYDAEISNICGEIDRLIKDNDLLAAWELAAFVSEKVNTKKSRALIADREKSIIAALRPKYDMAIANYNDEDYEVAAEQFKMIVTIKPSYEQAEAYFERCKTKIKALSGIE